ncbi:unnamed protein product [Absidia cylindrospora]
MIAQVISFIPTRSILTTGYTNRILATTTAMPDPTSMQTTASFSSHIIIYCKYIWQPMYIDKVCFGKHALLLVFASSQDAEYELQF